MYKYQQISILIALSLIIFSYQNCAPGFQSHNDITSASNTLGGSNPGVGDVNPEDDGPVIDQTNKKVSVASLTQFDRGTEVFFKNCLGCHGSDVDTSKKRNINLERLSFALGSIEDMKHLKLSEQDKIDVVFSLNQNRNDITSILKSKNEMPKEHISVCKPKSIKGSLSRRLNKQEYINIIKTSFGVDVNGSELPSDTISNTGYDNDGSVLFIEDGDGEKYYNLAERISKEVAQSGISFTKCVDGSNINASCFNQRVELVLYYLFRRNIIKTEVDKYVKFANGELNLTGYQKVLVAALMSPHYLFLNFNHKNLSVTSATPINQFELATRLSLFLWTDSPDRTLLDVAKNRQLSGAGLDQQIDRMLANPKSNKFVSSFTDQWLSLRNLADKPKETTSEEFKKIAPDMVKETRTFFKHILDNNLPVTELFTADYTFMNSNLAKYYDISRNGLNDNFVKVKYEDNNHLGLMTQGSYLSSDEHSGTSPIFRGARIMQRLLCVNPPSTVDPGSVPEIKEGETISNHSSDPKCASCHIYIDPLGSSLAGFNEIGQWKGVSNESEAAGTLPDGTPFNGVKDMMNTLAQRSELQNCIGENMATMTLGRHLTKDEACYVRELSIMSDKNIGLKDYIKNLIKSNIIVTEKPN